MGAGRREEGGREMSKRYAFMEKFVIPSFDEDGDYLVRYRIISTPLCSIFLHKIMLPDSRPVLHDHPWSFIAFVVKGKGYYEVRRDNHRPNSRTLRLIRRVNVMRRDDAHYIKELYDGPTWTLLLVGARRRTWGYWEKAPGLGQWHWTEFDKHPMAAQFDAAMARRAAR